VVSCDLQAHRFFASQMK